MLSVKLLSFAALVCLSSGAAETGAEVKKSSKRGIDDYGYPLGYNGWASTLKLNPVHAHPVLDRSNAFVPSAHDLSHLVAASKKAAHDVYVAQQYVSAAKEDVQFLQKLVKEKEALALIAHQKSENAQHVLRGEAHNVVLAQQKLAKAKAFAAELQIKQAVKDNEAAKAIQSSATNAHGEIQKAEQAAKVSHYKQSFKGGPAFVAPWAGNAAGAPWAGNAPAAPWAGNAAPAPWAAPFAEPWAAAFAEPWAPSPFPHKPLAHNFNSY